VDVWPITTRRAEQIDELDALVACEELRRAFSEAPGFGDTQTLGLHAFEL
jgi:hypothetical protein